MCELSLGYESALVVADVTDVTQVTDVVSRAVSRSRRHARHAVTSENFSANFTPTSSTSNASARARAVTAVPATRRQNP